MISEKRMKKKWVEFLMPKSRTNHPNMILRIDMSFLEHECDDMKADALKDLECAVHDFLRMKLPDFYDECELHESFFMRLNPTNEYGVGWELVVCGDNACGWFYEPPKIDRHSISV